MKQAFIQAGVRTPDMWQDGDLEEWMSDKFPIVAKSHFGSKCRGNTLIHNAEEFNTWKIKRSLKI